MALETYRKKRDFSKTTEPAGAPHPSGGLLYVIQKHAASRLHYDFRLELGGVLLSWAIPKGPSLDPRDKHLAVRVEDHPVEYGGFEGTIPKDEYGGGTVELWDRGTWEPEGDADAGLAKGDLKFTLHGEKLRGSWVLARMKRRSEEEGKEDWLLIKHRDEFAVDGDGAAILDRRPESVASGRTIGEIAAEGEASVWHSDKPASEQTQARPAEEFRLDAQKLPGAKKAGKMPRFVQPELATLVKSAPDGEQWMHEVKFDGYRAVSRIENGRVEMHSRNDKDWTGHYGPIAEELAKLPVRSAMLDGEVVVQLENGRTDFQSLQYDLGSGKTGRLLYYVFDLLYLDEYDLTGVPLAQRKKALKLLLARAGAGGRLRYAEEVRGRGPSFFERACTYGLEGIVSKNAESVYRPGVRGSEWLKTKCLQEQEFVIVGWTPPSGTRIGFGALLLAVHEPHGKLRYIGKVGTGFSDTFLGDFGGKLRGIGVPGPTVDRGGERAPKESRWVEPRYVAEVAFEEWTNQGGIRQPSFKGLREDKPQEQVVAEKPKPVAEVAEGGGRGGGEVLGVALTHPDRVFWPTDGTTKRDLAGYYEWIAPHMMPYVLHRPVSMVRCPAGVAATVTDFHEHQGPGPCFFHKHAGPDFPGPFERVEIVESGGPGTYLTITEPGSLVALAQMGVLEIHIWGSTWPEIERPDVMVFDLDPAEEVGYAQLVEAARLVRGVLGGLGLESFVKTTGGKGLHVCVPLEPKEEWDGVKAFAKAVADAIVEYAPDRYVSTMSKSKRVGKVFVDYLRNTRTATFIAPYSTRAKMHATVSVPLRWEELGGRVRPDTYTIANLRKRMPQLKGDPWADYFEVRQTITAKMKAEIGAD
ncbi:MAG TPA: DNA ligase D [Coriobacteriia bacterium]|jgi:bifunctional non-homologous end joining protein LigD